MVSCPRCGGESPADSKHCVHCGHPMDAEGVARTSFGMPKVNAQGPNAAAGAATTRFGAEDLARLAVAAAEAGLSESAPAQPEASPVQSLLAGLPRPRVSSSPSPLTSGRFNPDNPQGNAAPTGLGALPPLGGMPQPAPMSASRNTVMGMPVLGALGVPGGGATGEVAPPAAIPSVRRAGIASLDSFDVGGPSPAAAPQPGPIPAAQAAPSGLSLGKPAADAPAAPPASGLSLGKPADVAASPPAASAPGSANDSAPKAGADAAPKPASDAAPKPAPKSAKGGGATWILVAIVAAAAGAAVWYFFGRG